MNLLEATITLIDAARSLPENPALSRAIKRVEKRVKVLQIRKVNALRRRRFKAWYDALVVVGIRNPSAKRGDNLDVVFHVVCNGCQFKFDFTAFVRSAEISGHGKIKSLYCPECDYPIVGEPETVCSEKL